MYSYVLCSFPLSVLLFRKASGESPTCLSHAKGGSKELSLCPHFVQNEKAQTSTSSGKNSQHVAAWSRRWIGRSREPLGYMLGPFEGL